MPEVVANSTPIIALAKIARLDLLSVCDAVAELREIGFYVSDAVVDMALAAAGE